MIQLQDSENGKEILFDSSDKTWVKQISENQKNHNLKLKQVFNRANADLLHLDLNESYIKNLLNFLKKALIWDLILNSFLFEYRLTSDAA